MQVNKVTVKAIETALRLEEMSFTYYHKKYKELKEHLFRNLLLFLAHQEEDHIKYVNKIKKSLMKKGKWQKIKKLPKLTNLFKPIKKIDHETHEVQILHVAMEFERRTKEFYARESTKTKDSAVKRFFKNMAKYEEAHYKLLDGMYDSFMYVRLET